MKEDCESKRNLSRRMVSLTGERLGSGRAGPNLRLATRTPRIQHLSYMSLLNSVSSSAAF
jgi:hypothetical protein